MISNYCRLCMSEERLISIDSFFQNAIRTEFSVEIHNEDELSKEICKQCSEFVLKMVDFKKNVINVQKVLQKMLKSKSLNDELSDTNRRNSEDVVSNEIDTSNQHENLSGKKGEESTANEENVDSVGKAAESIDMNQLLACTSQPVWQPNGTTCDICRLEFTEYWAFLKHLKSPSHAVKSYVIKTDIFQKYHFAYKCTSCTMIFTNKKKLARHSREVHDVTINRLHLRPDTLILKRNIKCQPSVTNPNEENEQTVKNDETDESKVNVPDINIKTEARDDNDIERQNTPNEINPKKHPCKFCSKSFCFIESLSRHIRKHHPGKHMCIKCGFISVSSKLYAQHLRSHHNLTSHQRICSDCFKICNDYGELYAHRKLVHSTTKTFICSECHQIFATVVQLKDHKRQVHWAQPVEGKHGLRCRKCHRQFTSALVLKLHQCTAKKFACLKKCGRRFELYHEMERHMKRCTKGHTIYGCPNCKKRLSNLKTFKAHFEKCSLKQNSKDLDVHCVSCNISFFSSELMEKHNEEFHNKSDNSRTDEVSRNPVDTADHENEADSAKILIKTIKAKHRKKDMRPNVMRRSTKETTSKNNYLRCRTCSEKYLSVAELDAHFPNCSRQQFNQVKCHCGMSFVDKEVLRLHKLVDHKNDKAVIMIDEDTNLSNKSKKNQSENRLKPPSIDINNDGEKSIIQQKSTNEQEKNSSNVFFHSNENHVNAPSSSNKIEINQHSSRYKNEINTPSNKNEINQHSSRYKNKINTPSSSNKNEINTPSSSKKNKAKQSSSSKKNKIKKTPKNKNKIKKTPKNKNKTSKYLLRNKDDKFMSWITKDRNDKNSITCDKLKESATRKNVRTYACIHCGLVFQSEHFLKKHEQDMHGNFNLKPSKIPSLFSTPVNVDEKMCDYQYSHPDGNNSRSYMKQNYYPNRYQPMNREDRHNRSILEPEKYSDYRNRTHYDVSRRNVKMHEDNRLEFLHNEVPSDNLIRPKYSMNNRKVTTERAIHSNVNITITANANAICHICKNRKPHFFCQKCEKCYRENQVQYMNHMKMKHSS